jgi:hypothetical protein
MIGWADKGWLANSILSEGWEASPDTEPGDSAHWEDMTETKWEDETTTHWEDLKP